MFETAPKGFTSEPEQAPPWREEHGPRPATRSWDYGDRPALEVRLEGKWRYCTVGARADWADGRVAYHVDVPAPSGGGWTHRAYWWPQDGLRAAQRTDR
ncbi:hypothetical protein [Streptomyces sp. NPDC050428]|uniref:hypothetical protein n=1 Tax=Streptomyces sp. NPDC050428 TaxID=3155757 RepID=UPI00341E6B5A